MYSGLFSWRWTILILLCLAAVCFSNDCGPPAPLGMEDGSIKDTQITASSYWSEYGFSYPPSDGRLNSIEKYWAAEYPLPPGDPWFQIDLLESVEIFGIQMQGGTAYTQSDDEFITEVKIQVGNSEDTLHFISDNGNELSFPACTDRPTVKEILFPEPTTGRIIRIVATKFPPIYGHASGRFEVLGAKCPDQESPCSSDPCSNGAACEEISDGFECKCLPGFTGPLCETQSFCSPDPCSNGAACEEISDGFECKCLPGFTGPLCETQSLCSPDPCSNGATCEEISDGFECKCLPGFTGPLCETQSFCSPDPCSNGATCEEISDGFECKCLPGFTGPLCETQSPCSSDPCSNGAACKMTSEGFKCGCLPGFTGSLCETQRTTVRSTTDDTITTQPTTEERTTVRSTTKPTTEETTSVRSTTVDTTNEQATTEETNTVHSGVHSTTVDTTTKQPTTKDIETTTVQLTAVDTATIQPTLEGTETTTVKPTTDDTFMTTSTQPTSDGTETTKVEPTTDDDIMSTTTQPIANVINSECMHIGPITSLNSLSFEDYLSLLECQPDLALNSDDQKQIIEVKPGASEDISDRFTKSMSAEDKRNKSKVSMGELLQKTTNIIEEITTNLQLDKQLIINKPNLTIIADQHPLKQIKQAGWQYGTIKVLPDGFEGMGNKDDVNVTLFAMTLNDTTSLQSDGSFVYNDTGTAAYIASGVVCISVIVNGKKESVSTQYTQQLVLNEVESRLGEGESWEPQCVFWDQSDGVGIWSGHGCKLINDVQSDSATCYCSHTTNYAVLMRIKPSSTEEDSPHAYKLTTLTNFGCSFSIFALFFALIIFRLFRETILTKDRNIVHMHLMVAIFCAVTLFLISHSLGIKDNKVTCGIVAVLLHYAYLATFCWMLVEGIHLYRLIVIVYGNEKKIRWLYYLIGWAVPFVIVLVSVIIRYDHYGRNETCWLSTDNGFSWAFVGPVILVILLNSIILLIVVRTTMMFSREKIEHDNLAVVKSGLKTAFMLLPMLGITWIFGLLANFAIFFAYLFVIFNSLEGVWLVFVCCVLNTEVRQAILIGLQKKMNNTRVGIDTSVNFSTTNDSYVLKASAPDATIQKDVHVHVQVHTRIVETKTTNLAVANVAD